ncbi:MAG: aldehyde ferredoxin oxidoreductase family protein, partial [Anaerolineae bacterium]|nr:aldehyde ferredoxin oxidoreductase family protein [Anaerolineae bacterium]
MPQGYHGKMLHVDLTKHRWEVEEPSESFYRTYMGGSALAVYYLLKEMRPGVEPLSPENVLVFALSVLTGVPIHGNSRATAAARSPLTLAVGDSQAGGFWPAEAKFAGYDGIVLKGRAQKPVYLWINDSEVEIRDASHLWGLNTGDTMDRIREEVGDAKAEVVGIGQAGENLVRYAAIINMANRAHGRTGMGAVMGSKNLKAIAVRGKQRPELADRKTVLELAKWGTKNIDDIIGGLSKYGTANIVESQDFNGGLPTRNFTSGTFRGFENLTGPRMYETILKERDTCYACATKCKRVVEVKNPDGSLRVDPRFGGPEYEGLATLGSYCEVDDLVAVSEAFQHCNAYGMDVISCGATIAWAMECYERGLLNKDDTGGIDLRFGNGEALVQAVHAIALRQGKLGGLLAEGSARAAQKIGRGSEEFTITVKGQEAPAHMPHVKRSLALIYAVNPFGADHMSSEHDPHYDSGASRQDRERLAELGLMNPQERYVLNEEKVRFTFYSQCMYSALDTLGLCQFDWGGAWQLYGPNQLVDLVRAVTGWDVSLFEIMKVGERRLNLMRAFNAREGIGREEDRLTKRLHEALKGGNSDGVAVTKEELEAAKDVYYEMAGWDVKTGMPRRAKLVELSLG